MRSFLQWLGIVTLTLFIGADAHPQKHASFKVDVNLVTVLVNVKDESGTPITNLEPHDFTILDEGIERKIAVFERRTDRPLSVALMLDSSLSTAKELPYEREAAKRFLINLLGPRSQPADQAAVLKFSDFVDLLTGFTRSQSQLNRALDEIRADSGTSVYDAVLLTSQILKQRKGRRVMVVITDGGDTTSRIPFHEALTATHGIDGVIYGIIVVPIQSDAGRNIGGENALKTLASNTGGETFIQYGTADLDKAFQEILLNLRTQYLIAYYPSETTSRSGFRSTEIQVHRAGAQVLARNGYFVRIDPLKPGAIPNRISVQPKPQP